MHLEKAELLMKDNVALKPLPMPFKKPPRPTDDIVLGFDSEYSSDLAEGIKRAGMEKMPLCNELVSFQFVGEHEGKPFELFAPYTLFDKYTGERGVDFGEFAEYIWEELGCPAQKIVLWSFFSHAEYSVLDVYSLDQRLTFTPTGGDSFAARWHDKKLGCHVEIVDLKSFFPTGSLAAVAESFGLRKMWIDRTKVHRGLIDDHGFRAYALMDARLCFEIGTKLRSLLWRELTVDLLQARTPAAAAGVAWRRHYLKPDDHYEPNIRKQIRFLGLACYWGGVNISFYRGRYDKPLRMFDAVSMYPTCAMRLGKLPTSHDWRRVVDKDVRDKKVLGGLVVVRFAFPESVKYPCLPVFEGGEESGRLVFPLEGLSYCTLEEVRFAAEQGAELEILDGYVYEGGDDSVSRFCADMLERKNKAEQENDIPRRSLYKLLANGLIGKFAQKRIEIPLENQRKIAQQMEFSSIKDLWDMRPWELVLTPEACAVFDIDLSLIEEKRTVGGCFAPEWAALILGYARAIECRAISRFGALSASTDSVIIPLNRCTADEFEVRGVRFVLQYDAQYGSFIKNRMYALKLHEKHWTYDEQGKPLRTIKAALHGAPFTPETRDEVEEAILNWGGKESHVFSVNRIRKIKDGMIRGQNVGMSYTRIQTVSFRHDMKRDISGEHGEIMNAFTKPRKRV